MRVAGIPVVRLESEAHTLIMTVTLSELDSSGRARLNQLAALRYGNGWKFWSAAPGENMKPGTDAVWLVRDREFRRVVIDLATGEPVG